MFCMCLFGTMNERNKGIRKLVAAPSRIWFYDAHAPSNRVATTTRQGGNSRFSAGFRGVVQHVVEAMTAQQGPHGEHTVAPFLRLVLARKPHMAGIREKCARWWSTHSAARRPRRPIRRTSPR